MPMLGLGESVGWLGLILGERDGLQWTIPGVVCAWILHIGVFYRTVFGLGS